MILFDKNRSGEARGPATVNTCRPLLTFALFFLCLYPENVPAAELITECPSTKPGYPDVGFKYGEPLPEGIRAAGGPSALETKDGLLYAEYIYGTEPLYNSSLECTYQDGAEVKIPIPGGLLRCDKVIREDKAFPNKSEFLRVWCVSRVP